MQSQKLFRSLVARTVSKRNMSYGHGEHRVVGYNDLPTPQGSWQTAHDAQQRKYNMHLVFGVAFAIGSVIFARATGLLYFNYDAPKKPADGITYK